jgi:hypothetical protein
VLEEGKAVTANRKTNRTMKTMKLGIGSALALAAMIFASPMSQAANKDQIDKSFDVKPGGTLVLEADRGNVELKAGDDNKVLITVVREHKGSASDAKDALAAHKINFTQDGDKVTVKGTKTKSGWNNKFNKLSVRYTITTPKNYNLQLGTAGGNLKISGVTGTHKLDTAGGNIDMRDLAGSLVAKTAGGNIIAVSCKGPLETRTAGGNIEIQQSEGNIIANTSGGNISIEGASGKVIAKTSGGNIEVKDLKGSIEGMSHGGNVRAHFIKAPDGACSLKTSAGTINVDVGPEAKFDVYARTSAGRVTTDFDVKVENKFAQGKLDAKINGGGPQMNLETSAGDIRIRKI